MKEYIIWGVDKGKDFEEVLMSGLKHQGQVDRLLKRLSETFHCTQLRVSEIDLSVAPDFINTINK